MSVTFPRSWTSPARISAVAPQVFGVDRGLFRFQLAYQIEFSAAAGTHKRKDITDLARLEQFLVDRSMGHAFEFIFKGGQGATAART